MKYAILAADRKSVENVILADEAFCEAAYPGRWAPVADTEPAEPGGGYDAVTGHFSRAPAPDI